MNENNARSIDVSHFRQDSHTAQVDTLHPGPIEMMDDQDTCEPATLRDLVSIWLVIGILAGLVLASFAAPLIENLPDLMRATAK